MPKRARDAFLRNSRPTKQLRLDNAESKDEKEYLKKYRWMIKFRNIKEKQKNEQNTKDRH